VQVGQWSAHAAVAAGCWLLAAERLDRIAILPDAWLTDRRSDSGLGAARQQR